MSEDKFCLRWNDFESNLSSAIQEVREEKELYDVTVACDGGGEFPAHRLVLSACSLVLRQVLCRKSHLAGHQVVYLRGVNSQDLKFILSFMYQGEVSLAQHQLNSFLAVAEDLQVKGLIQKDSDRTKPKPAAESRKDLSSGKPRSQLNTSRSAATVSRPPEDDEIQEIPAVKAEPYQTEYQEVSGGGQLIAAEDTDLMYQQDSYGGGDQMVFDEGVSQGITDVRDPTDLIQFVVENPQDHEGKTWTCSICTKFSHRSKSNVRNHIEAVHYGNSFSYTCPTCGHKCSSRNALNVHMSRYHKH